jgi:hypothetical protein
VRRDEFEHAIRAAGAILGVDELLIIGSQALHGSVPGAFAEAVTRSVEVDIAVCGDADGRMADLLDGSIGEGSLFHETFGYYAQGVVETTAMLPRGWRDRLVRFASPATNDVVAWCLEPHDLWISKAIARRPKDIEFWTRWCIAPSSTARCSGNDSTMSTAFRRRCAPLLQR